jgi:F-type H+-transporting ATPase subunit epsilon
VGILRGHAPLLSLLTDAVVEISIPDGGVMVAVVDGGFISVANNEVRLLCEHAEISHESNYDEAKRLLEEAKERAAAAN